MRRADAQGLRRASSLLTGLLAVVAVVVALGVGLVAGVPADVPPRPTSAPSPGAEVGTPTPSPSPTPTPSPSPPPFTDRALVADLTALVAAARGELSGGRLSVVVATAAGSDVLDHRGDRPMLPASTMKLATAAGALEAFGADHRFHTQARSTGAISDDGVLDGDLVLVGSGDPALATPAYGRSGYPVRPRTRLEDLADALVAAGLTRVTGDVVGSDPDFEGDTLARGWRDRYLSGFDARHITGLTVDAGLRVRGGGEDGAPVRLRIADRPARVAALQLRALLEERDVDVAGRVRARTVDEPGDVLGEVTSPPLSELLRHTVRRSDNHMADTLFKAVGGARAGAGSWTTGAHALRETLTDLGVDPSGARFADGSGLSRRDRLSARQLVDIGEAMSAGEHAHPWSRLLAVTGGEGTLRHRLRDTLAEGRFLGKTGTLDDVVSVGGTVVSPTEDAVYHLAVVGNGTGGADRGVVRALMDRLILTLVADVDDCRVTPPRRETQERSSPTPSPSASPTLDPLGLPPAEVTCPRPEPAASATPSAVATSVTDRRG